jgi:Arc/MetJ family transcription regulator
MVAVLMGYIQFLDAALKIASMYATFDASGAIMRTTITIDDKLLANAKASTGIAETPALVRKALEALVQREAARRLAKLGGTMPELEDVARGHATK